MQARRATALVVSCVLGFCLLSAAHFGAHTKHPARAVAILTAASADPAHGAGRQADDAVPSTPDTVAAPRFVAGTSNTSQRVSPRTAQTPLIRGPPDQGSE